MSGFSCSTGAEPAPRTWGIVRKDEGGPGDQVEDFENGTRVGGDKVPNREGFFDVDLLGKVDEVANLVDSSLNENRVERPPLLVGNDESSCN